jgi:peptidoglycan/LPS O-acetylase OafA/YrhL
LDKWLGDMAYPVFLTHFLAIGLVRLVTRGRLDPLSLSEAICVFLVTLMLSAAVVRWFDPALNSLRDMVRPKKNGVAGRPPVIVGVQ